jgi:tyrosine-protein phosphatase OCA1
MYVHSIRTLSKILMADHLPPLPPPPEPLIIQALTYLLQPQTFPTLVCCNMGRHRSGTVVGCYRKLQRWALSSILEEYRRYAGAKVRVLNEQVSYVDALVDQR